MSVFSNSILLKIEIKKTKTIDSTTEVINPAVIADNINPIIVTRIDVDRFLKSASIFLFRICLIDTTNETISNPIKENNPNNPLSK